MNYQYSYLMGTLILLIFWLILFLWRKDTRKEMLIISIIFGFIGLIVEGVYILDWWRPLTITNTAIGIEDFLFGFTVAGMAAVGYEIIFKKKLKIKKANKKIRFRRNKSFILISLLGLSLFFGSYFILGLNTFYSSVIAFAIPILIIWIKRKDLITNSLVTGLLGLIGAPILFMILEFLTPGWVESAWHFTNISKIIRRL
ncbi:MAG TPA: lycopene cyclase domain-containing protein [Candidatus Nanoarchaeia archaeon]|nr:lycopene cyclase domain-containing protein [Candidatus Nanoarchaeia archaeon]